ncbi:MAG: T9SS type A sorting domain-containing protein [Bacteroidales bacterium]|nr:T9SS type A sorting domain-containing protein [Bacteroidales bacterium]
MKKINILLLALLTSFSIYSFAQKQSSSSSNHNEKTPSWVDMMSDRSVNFYDVQKEFNEYFKNKPNGKGTGWKQFKRWEWFMEPRVYPSGDRFDQVMLWEEVEKYKEEHSLKSTSVPSDWQELGPRTSANVTGHWNPGIGRINVIMRDPFDTDIIYIGTPSGGLWKTTDEGQTWNVLTDNLPVIGVSAVAIDYTNTDIVYIGTGDKDAGDNYSIGVLKSFDGGQTWEETGLCWTIGNSRTIAKLIIHPEDPNILLAATSNGVYKTIDGGDIWLKVHSGGIDDIDFKPGEPDIVYCITRSFFKSTDGGDSFTQISGVPGSSRSQIAVTEANPEYVYFFSSASGLFLSTDSGESFTKQSDTPTSTGQAWYDLACAASHVNPEEIHIGAINTFRSENGGKDWTRTTDWTWGNPYGYTHCDIHEIVFFGGDLFVGSDGLISKSSDHGDNWTNLTEGIGMRQFYRIACSKTNPNKYMGGSQDNGTSVYTDDHWHEWLGADGMECVIDWTDDNIVYGTSQNGNFYKSNTGGNNGGINITQPGGGAWVTPFVMDPFDHNTLYVGSSNVRKTTDGMQSWETISNLGGGNINNLSIAESDGNYLYASKSSNIWGTKNGGDSWQNITTGLADLSISYIAVNPKNPEKIAVSLSGFDEGNKVFVSENAGDTWTNISGSLPNIPANCVIYNCDPDEGLFVGMDVGIYFKDNTLDDWEPFMTNLPNVIVNELEIHYETGRIRAGTYGRGLWESDLMIPPIADFEADNTIIPIQNNVDFSDLSYGPPQEYYWTFEGGQPETSTDENPTVVYNDEGIYDVSLLVTNELGSNTIIKEDYITVSTTLLPATEFSASDSVLCEPGIIDFFDKTTNFPISWEWSFSPDDISFVDGTNAYSQNPSVSFESYNAYSVTLTTTNINGEHSLTKSEYIYIGGAYLPFDEAFDFDSFDESSWIIENPDNSITWEIATVGGNSPGNKAAMLNFRDYYAIGKRDRMISTPLNLTDYSSAHLSFQHAYAKYYEEASDSLIIYISADCGETWERIFADADDGSGNFATHPLTTSDFVPTTEDDWCGSGYGSECNSIDISNWIGNTGVRIAFESYSFFGNPLFIDNVAISDLTAISEIIQEDENLRIFPNPAEGVFNLEINDIEVPCEISVMNINGQTVFTDVLENIEESSIYKLDLSKQTAGIYIFKLSNSLFIKTKKIIIK